jgi:DNA-binding MarR family transcriptional regulator
MISPEQPRTKRARPNPEAGRATGTDPVAGAEHDTAPRLRAVVGKLSRRLRPTLAGSGLTPTRLSVLATLARRGPLRISELASIEGLNPTMLSRLIAELSGAGLLARVPDPDDGRAALVDATAAGRRLHKKIQGERNDVLSVLLAGLDEDRRGDLVKALGVLEELAERLKERPL